MHFHSQRRDSLSPEQMAIFSASLANLPSDEVRKAKSLYIRNALSEYRAMTEGIQNFRQMQGCMAIIPVFWPVLAMQRRQLAIGERLHQERIKNALEVWKADLQGETFDLPWENERR